MEKQRTYGIDLARTVAITFVLGVHSLLYNGFYEQPVQGIGMAVGTVLRMALVSAVPLFLLLTGFLCINRRWSRGYYRKLLPVLIVYLLASLACLLMRALWGGECFSVLGVFRRILDFSAAPYGWYVEMYIGLFLLMPFLNVMWAALDGKKQKVLLLTLTAVTALPTLINVVWQIVPEWWTRIYPLTYYFWGAWLREHPVRGRRLPLLLGWIDIAAAVGLVYYFLHQYLRPGQIFYSWDYDYRAALPTLVQTICLFSFLRQFDGSRTPKAVRWCVSRVAKITLPIHLLSYVTDCWIYPVLCRLVPTVTLRICLLPVVLIVHLAVTGVMAQVVDWISNGIMKLVPEGKEKTGSMAK